MKIFGNKMVQLSDMTPEKLKAVVLALTPEINPILQSLKKITQTQKEAAKEAFNAANEAALDLEINDNLPPVVKAELNLYVKTALSAAANAGSTDRGFDILNQMVQIVFTDCYENIISVLAILQGVEKSEIKSKTTGELVDLVIEILQDKMLISFFPQLKALARKTP